jgi:hypothetical protein
MKLAQAYTTLTLPMTVLRAQDVQLHAMEAHGARGGIAPTHS